ncbi:hypothetical protein HDU89_007726 [Geranomyces variabilis]|nr:hypothetical protein HDU89_007726 [Geranomyces variabilis]
MSDSKPPLANVYERKQPDALQQSSSPQDPPPADSGFISPAAIEPAPLKKNRKLPTRWGSAFESPVNKAGFFSTITYSWMNPVFWVGWNRPLDMEDVWQLPPNWQVQQLHAELDHAWQVEVERANAANAAAFPDEIAVAGHEAGKSTEKLTGGSAKPMKPKFDKNGAPQRVVPNLRRAMWNSWFWRIAPMGLVKFFSDMTSVFSPFLVKYILLFVAESKGIYALNEANGTDIPLPPLARGFGYAVGLLVLAVAGTLTNNIYFQVTTTQGMALRSAITAAIYRKSLRLSAAARQDFNAGRVMTVVATDAQRIEMFLQFITVLITAPLQILAISIFLITQLGPTALAGIGLLVVMGPFQKRIMKRLGTIRKSVAPLTDQRVKLTQEILSGIRVIKFFAWNRPYLSKVEEVRKAEVHQVLRRGLLQAFVMSLAFGIPIIAGCLAIFLYAVTNPLDATKIFPALTWFTQLRFPLMFLPQIIVGLADFNVALTRITDLLIAPELDAQPEKVKTDEFAIRVRDAEFIWEAPPPKAEDDNAKKKGKDGKHGKDGKNGKDGKDGTDGQKARGLVAKSPNAEDAAVVAVASAAAPAPIPAPVIAGDSSDASDESTAIDTASASQNSAAPVQPDTPVQPDLNRATLFDINLSIPKGSLVAIVGPVGSGKSSLLNGLIGEMKRRAGTVEISGTLGYCPQQAWIQNATVRENILFGQPFERTKYLRVLRDCALEPDLAVLADADFTQIGEKGVNLSGGQKQRVAIARLAYQGCEIMSLDDPLSAVDAHVGRYLFEQFILKNKGKRTTLLATHQLHVLPQVDYIICMKGGRIVERGTYQDLMDVPNGDFAALMRSYGGVEEASSDDEADDVAQAAAAKALLDQNVDEEIVLARIEKTIRQTKSARQLMSTEEKASGSVGLGVWLAYMNAAGGKMFLFWLLFLISIVQVSRVGTDLWLVEWTNYKISSLSNGQYVAIYWAWGVFQTIMIYIFGMFFAFAGTRAARVLHGAALARVMEAPVRFFDSNPLGRIINRFSKDTDTVDTTLADSFRMFINTFSSAVSTFVLIIYATPIFLAPLVPILGIYYLFQKVYRGASRELKRLDSTTRSPLYASFGETLVGAATIRAYGEQDRFIAVNDARINGNNAPYFLLITAQRWLAIRLETLGGIMVFFAATFGLLNRTNSTLTAALLGLSLSYALQVTTTLNWCVRQFTETEIAMNAVERVHHYGHDIDAEPMPAYPPPSDLGELTVTVDPTPPGATSPPPAGWPATGAVEIDNLTLQYAPDLPVVLRSLTLQIKHQEKVGVVGRTGSGKSTLIQSLFRTIEPCLGSSIKIDGLDTRSIPLEDLRRAIAIIPQDPTLFSGTFRSNLDPFSEYSDADLHLALHRAQLTAVVAEKGGLDGSVSEGGENLSVGTRQLLCLARAVVKKPRLLVLDECTANVDLETDALVQKILREECGNCSILCIAHRLNTIIDYDRVLVLQAGRVVEFDTPRNLLANPDGVFSAMIEQTGAANAELLRSMVK